MPPIWSYLLLLVTAVACAPDAPPLVVVHDIRPTELSVRDVLRVRGGGFPEGAEAQLRLVGTRWRSGEAPADVSVGLAGTAVTSETVSASLGPVLVDAISGSGEDGRHATFRGRLSVSFAPKLAGAPPVTGTALVSFDLFPELSHRVFPGAKEELGAFLGASWETRRGGGLELMRLSEDGPLAAAGLRTGDVLVRNSKLRIKTSDDLMPYPGQDSLELRFMRPGYLKPQVAWVGVAGLRAHDAADWQWSLGLLAALVVLILLARSRQVQTVLLSVPATRARLRLDEAGRPPARDAGRGFVSFLAVSALFSALHMGTIGEAADFDLLLLYAVFFASHLAYHMSHLLSSRRNWSRAIWLLVRGMAVPILIAMVLVGLVLETGSLSLGQGAQEGLSSPWPLGMSPSRQLGALVLFAVLILEVRPLPSSATAGHWVVAGLARFTDSTRLLLLAGLGVGLYLGGWQVPDWLPSQSALLPALIFEAKLAGCFLLIVAGRRVLPVVDALNFATHWRVLLPLATLALALIPIMATPVWPSWILGSLSVAATSVSVVGALALIVVMMVGGRGGVKLQATNPWL